MQNGYDDTLLHAEETAMRRKRFSILKSAVQLAVLYIPALFLLDFVEAVCPFANVYVQAAAGAACCFCALFSDSVKTALKKWACSVPFTLAFWHALVVTNFNVRLTNKLFPGYGRLSAGAGFALIVEFGLFTVAQGLANLLAITCSAPLNSNKLQKTVAVVQNAVLPVICALLVFAVLYLEATMPTWGEIFSSVYG